MPLDKFEKMETCRYRVEGYLEDNCTYDDTTYNFDDPDNACCLWNECADCNNWKPKQQGRGIGRIAVKSKRGRKLGMTKKETEDARGKEPHSSGGRSKAAWLN